MTCDAPPSAERTDAAPRRLPPGVPAVAIVALGAAAYANSFRVPFVFDDKGSILENASIRSLSSWSEVLLGATYASVVGRPVLNLSLALDYALFGTDPRGYHVVNLAIHLLAGLTLLGVVRRTLALPLAPAAWARRSTEVAFAVAALWTVHPLQTESVTYVVQRAESLGGLFVLLSMWCSVRGLGATRPSRWSAAAVAACAFAAGTKETAVAAPLLVLLHDRAFATGTFRGALLRRPAMYAGLAASWGLLAACIASSGGRAGTAGFDPAVSAWRYAATQPAVICDYLRLAFWPDPLVFDRGANLATSAAEVVPYALAVAAMVAATLHALARRPQIGFVGAWFFLILAPTSSFVPLLTQTEAEHRMYLPLAAVVVLAVAGADAVRRRIAAAGARSVANAVAASFLAVAVLGLAWGTRRRNETYATALSLWRHTAEHAPANERAQLNYGIQLACSGDEAGAIRRFDLATALAPSSALPHLLRGLSLDRLGRGEEAVAAFTKAIALQPLDPVARNNRGAVHAAAGRHEEAIADFDAAIASEPGYAEAYANRAASRLELRWFDGAWQDVASCRALGCEPSAAFLARLVRASGADRSR